MSKIVPNLWSPTRRKSRRVLCLAVAGFENRQRDRTARRYPSGPAGSVKVVEFTLMGQPFMAISAGPFEPFNHAVSFMVQCDDQAEIDRLWDALSQGGKTEQCGWLQDRYGLSWQIAPAVSAR